MPGYARRLKSREGGDHCSWTFNPVIVVVVTSKKQAGSSTCTTSKDVTVPRGRLYSNELERLASSRSRTESRQVKQPI